MTNDYTNMARNCLSAIELIEKGEWTVQDMKEWLQAVVDSDVKYLSKIKTQYGQHKQIIK